MAPWYQIILKTANGLGKICIGSTLHCMTLIAIFGGHTIKIIFLLFLKYLVKLAPARNTHIWLFYNLKIPSLS